MFCRRFQRRISLAKKAAPVYPARLPHLRHLVGGEGIAMSGPDHIDK
jgi:hypothetical protein